MKLFKIYTNILVKNKNKILIKIWNVIIEKLIKINKVTKLINWVVENFTTILLKRENFIYYH